MGNSRHNCTNCLLRESLVVLVWGELLLALILRKKAVVAMFIIYLRL